jgi:hypothetical protein
MLVFAYMVTRRKLLQTIGAGTAASLAGCSVPLLSEGTSDSVAISEYGSIEVGDAEYSVEDGQMTVSYDGGKISRCRPRRSNRC